MRSLILVSILALFLCSYSTQAQSSETVKEEVNVVSNGLHIKTIKFKISIRSSSILSPLLAEKRLPGH